MSQVLVNVFRALAWALSPDPDQARKWLGGELSKPEYRESLLERVARWFNDLISSIGDATRHVGLMNPVLAVVLLVVLAGLLALLLSRLRRNVAVPEQGASVFAQRRLSAAEHRRSAQEALEQAEWDRAVVESVRALAAGLVERGLVPEQADVTVHELTERAAALYPSVAGRLRRTGLAFDETRYGDRPADEERARAAAALELDVSSRGPEATSARGPVSAVPR